MGNRCCRDVRARRNRVSRGLRHRCQHRNLVRNRQRALGHPGVRGRDLPDRAPARLLCRPLQHRPRFDHSGKRIRLLRVGGHQRHLCDVHVHLLRARRFDHGAGTRTGTEYSVAHRVRGIDDHGDPAGYLRHESPCQTSGLDHPAVAGADGAAVRLPGDQQSRFGRRVLRLRRPGRGRRQGRQHRIGDARGRRVSLAHRADRRADRLPAFHAAQDSGEFPALVDCSASRRTGLGDLRCSQAGRRPLPGRVPDRQRRRRIHHRQRAGAPVPGDLRELHARLARHDPRGDPGRHQPDQDQRHQRLLGITGVDQLLHPHHQDVSGSHGVRAVQPRDRTDPDGSQHVQLPQQHPRLLRQLRHRVDCRRGFGHRVQQVHPEALAQGARVPTRHALQHQPGRLRIHGGLGNPVDSGLLRGIRVRDQAVLADRGSRSRTGASTHPGGGNQGQVLPATHRRRYRPADVRRAR